MFYTFCPLPNSKAIEESAQEKAQDGQQAEEKRIVGELGEACAKERGGNKSVSKVSRAHLATRKPTSPGA